jgi:hypothetical protein
MLGTYLVGVAITVAVSLVWVGVQNAWRATFADVQSVSDALSGRLGCDGCARESACEPHRQKEVV